MATARLLRASPPAAPPALLARACQRRWDTSPYRGVHRLSWARLSRVEWPYGGSVAWQPSWGRAELARTPAPWDAEAARPPARRASAAPVDAAQAPEQLHRRLGARLGLGPAEAMTLLQRGLVEVNGRQRLRNCWVGAEDAVAVNGHSLEELSSLALLAHKPAGCALSEGDPLMRPTYTSLLPEPTMVAQPVGQVDTEASGLLLLTNRPDLIAAFRRHPGPAATFVAILRDHLLPWQVSALRECEAYGPKITPLAVEATSHKAEEDAHGSALVRVTLRGGGASRLRRALAVVGARAGAVHCTDLGPLSLYSDSGVLDQPGSFRPLSLEEEAAVLDGADEQDGSY